MEEQGWFTFIGRDQPWVALLSWLTQPWFQLTWKAVLFIDTGIMMPLLWALADSWVKMKLDSDAVRAWYLYGRRRRNTPPPRRLPLYLIKVRGEAGESD